MGDMDDMHDTTGETDSAFTRRLFLQRGLTFASLAATTPMFIERSAQAMALPLHAMVSSIAGVPDERVLVVVQLGGGNDGLNTVVPYGQGAYYDARPNLSIPAPGRGVNNRPAALQIDDVQGVGLHPNLTGLKELMDEGVASIVQGVGYPNPNRSHFTSMDVWHTADESAKGNGWIGRYFDNTCGGTPDPEGSVAIGNTAPLAMVGAVQKPVTFETADLFRWAGTEIDESLGDPYQAITRAGALPDAGAASGQGQVQAPSQGSDQLEFLMRTALDAQVSSDRIRQAVAKRPLVTYPNNPLSRQLQVVGAMIRSGMKTRVYYVSLGGFDTHANQLGQHANLMRQVGSSLLAFYKDIKAQGNNGRVLTMVFSEFGRRVRQNGSGGTDHGTAAPMYLVGDMVRPGLLGDHPSLTRLDEGDLVFNVDFRSVYASVLDEWMKADSKAILGRPYRKAKILSV